MAAVAVLVLVGIGLLAVAPDRFVSGSAGLADRWGMSRVVIGAVVIGFGTSSPELLVSGLAAAGGNADVGVGNIIGSNMANLGLVMAVAALVGHLAVPQGLLRRELPIVVVATVAFAIAVQNGLSRIEGLALLAGLATSLWLVIRTGRSVQPADRELDSEIDEFLAEEEPHSAWRLVSLTSIGLVGTLAGAQLLVTGAVKIADELGVSGGVVGLTVVALGTSLPELVTAIAATRAGEDQLILGNVLGSNLFNCLAVGAVVGLADAGPLDEPAVTVNAVALMLVITGLTAGAMSRRQVITRNEALTLLGVYLVSVPLLV